MPSKALPSPRLGRGLSSLIKIPDPIVREEIPSSSKNSSALSFAIPIKNIHPNPHQPRRQFNENTLSELAASIKSAGIIQPIIVRQAGDGYELIAGERRWRAAQIAGLIEIPAIVRQVDSFTQAQMALIENVQREDLNPLDRAAAYQSLIDQLGLTQNELAIRLGEDRSSIANFLRLLALAEPVRELVRSGRLSLGHAKVLAGIDNLEEQSRLANLAVERELPVRNLEHMIRLGQTAAPTPQQPKGVAAHITELEQSITRQLGLRVQIRQGTKAGNGKIIIHYANLDQFDELLKRVNIDTAED